MSKSRKRPPTAAEAKKTETLMRAIKASKQKHLKRKVVDNWFTSKIVSKSAMLEPEEQQAIYDECDEKFIRAMLLAMEKSSHALNAFYGLVRDMLASKDRRRVFFGMPRRRQLQAVYDKMPRDSFRSLTTEEWAKLAAGQDIFEHETNEQDEK
jgi:hypothetical protein